MLEQGAGHINFKIILHTSELSCTQKTIIKPFFQIPKLATSRRLSFNLFMKGIHKALSMFLAHWFLTFFNSYYFLCIHVTLGLNSGPDAYYSPGL